MPDIYTPAQVAECREMLCSGASCTPASCDGCKTPPDDGEECPQFTIAALCATVEALREVVEWQCRTKCAGYSSECTDRCRAAQVFRARELSR